MHYPRRALIALSTLVLLCSVLVFVQQSTTMLPKQSSRDVVSLVPEYRGRTPSKLVSLGIERKTKSTDYRGINVSSTESRKETPVRDGGLGVPYTYSLTMDRLPDWRLFVSAEHAWTNSSMLQSGQMNVVFFDQPNVIFFLESPITSDYEVICKNIQDNISLSSETLYLEEMDAEVSGVGCLVKILMKERMLSKGSVVFSVYGSSFFMSYSLQRKTRTQPLVCHQEHVEQGIFFANSTCWGCIGKLWDFQNPPVVDVGPSAGKITFHLHNRPPSSSFYVFDPICSRMFDVQRVASTTWLIQDKRRWLSTDSRSILLAYIVRRSSAYQEDLVLVGDVLWALDEGFTDACVNHTSVKNLYDRLVYCVVFPSDEVQRFEGNNLEIVIVLLASNIDRRAVDGNAKILDFVQSKDDNELKHVFEGSVIHREHLKITTKNNNSRQHRQCASLYEVTRLRDERVVVSQKSLHQIHAQSFLQRQKGVWLSEHYMKEVLLHETFFPDNEHPIVLQNGVDYSWQPFSYYYRLFSVEVVRAFFAEAAEKDVTIIFLGDSIIRDMWEELVDVLGFKLIRKPSKESCFHCFGQGQSQAGDISLYFVWAHVKWNPEQLRGALNTMRAEHSDIDKLKTILIMDKGIHFLRLPMHVLKGSAASAAGANNMVSAFTTVSLMLFKQLRDIFIESNVIIVGSIFATMPAVSSLTNGLPRVDRLDSNDIRRTMNQASVRSLYNNYLKRINGDSQQYPVAVLDILSVAEGRYTKEDVFGLHYGPTAKPHISSTRVNRMFINLVLDIVASMLDWDVKGLPTEGCRV